MDCTLRLVAHTREKITFPRCFPVPLPRTESKSRAKASHSMMIDSRASQATYPYSMSQDRAATHNFAAGPSPLPTHVLEEAAKGLLNYNGTGIGICELSHRGKEFKGIVEGAEGELAAEHWNCILTHQQTLGDSSASRKTMLSCSLKLVELVSFLRSCSTLSLRDG